MFLASPGDLRVALAPRIEAFAARLDSTGFQANAAPTEPLIDMRLRSRHPGAAPVHLGLYAPNKQGGVILTSVPSVHYADFNDREKQLDFLASRLPGGAGFHGVFSKTVGVIGPDKQLDAWERYLRDTEGNEARLYRFYGRDFWMP